MKARYSTGRAIVFIMAIMFLTGGCSGTNSWFGKFLEPATPEIDITGDEIVMSRDAMHYFDIGRYLLAEEIFQKVRDRFPFSPQATLAELRLADCKYYRQLYEEAIPLYQEFEKLHPNNEAITYVIFMEGSCYHELMDSADRDQTNTHKMIDIYDRLLKRYPDSPFTYEATKRMHEGRNLLADHELVVARWYARTGQNRQAINRLNILLAMYPDTDFVYAARDLLAKQTTAMALDEQKEEQRVKAIGEPWYKRIWPF